MKLNKYIRQLLTDNEMVIIPGFGAFISEYQPAEIDDATDELKPPSTRLIFNPQIRNNDGLLVGYVAELTRNSHFEALQKIEKERDNIIYQLDKGEKVELENLGTLYYNADNQVEFISESDKNLSHESFGLESVSLTEPGAEENIEEETAVTEPVEPEETTPAAEGSSVDEEAVSEQEPEAEESAEEILIPPVTEEIKENESIQEEEKQVEEVVPAEKIEEKEKKRKGGWVWFLVILIPLIAVSVFLLMKEKQDNTPISNQDEISNPEVIQQPIAVIDTLEKDSTKVVPQDSAISEEAETGNENKLETSGPKFYLIGGSFKEEENAETYMEVLQDKGFEPFKMGKYGNFYILGIGTYDTEEEAVAAKREFLDKSPDSGIWILEK